MHRMGLFTVLFLVQATFPFSYTHSACPFPTAARLHQVDYVYDGDSLLLSDGSRVRLAGINTPELGHGEEPDEPFAPQAHTRLQQLIEGSSQRIRLQSAAETRDRYGRLLGHAYTPDGISLQEHILSAGLGLTHVHPPNLTNLDCYRQAEGRARGERLGIWRNLPIAATNLEPDSDGFVVLRDQVNQVRNSRRSVWLELHAGLSVRIARGDLGYFDALDLNPLAGRQVEVRGWLHHYRNRLQIRIRHPAALRVVE